MAEVIYRLHAVKLAKIDFSQARLQAVATEERRAIVILSVYFFKMTKYQFLILVLLTIFLNCTTVVIGMLLRLM